ncbi:inositol-trisphosphate 3-kinase A [Rhipicephalus microplus]|uniref:inositol-trisphosphate 3-kinase A n=1 Tax=Rhipicephalus microplus TaxID=6941 RepID=UPI003F6B0751
MESERRGDDGDSGEASPTFRRVGSRTRSRSFNNSPAAAASSSPSRKEECGGSRSPRAVACGTTTKKAYSLESIQRCKRWRPCQLLREVFAKTPLLFGARRQPHKATTSSMAPETLSSEDSGHAESPVSLVSVVIETPPSPPGVGGDPPSKSRRSCSADSAVDFDTGDEALLASPLGGDGDGGGSDNGGDGDNNGVVLVDNSSVVDRHCTVLVDGGTVVLDGNSLHQPPHPQHQLHRTSLPGDRSKRPLSQCLSLSCPVLSAPSVVVSDFSSCDVSPEIIEEVDADLSSGGELRDYLSLGGRSCSSCSLSSTVSSASWDDEASQSDVSEAGSACSSKPSGWRKVRNVVHWSPFVQTYRKYKYPWIQLAGHQGNFRSGTQGTILKKLCGKEESCLKQLMRDPWLRDYVPEFKGRVEMEDCSTYLELQDLLAGFQCPCVMDVKVGLRTYLEEELAKAREKPKLRKDMYEKMVAVDPDEPTPEEHELKAVTKPRYMIWRETISSTASLGFRIEGIKNPDGTSTKDFKTTKSREQVLNAIDTFTKGFDDALGKYLQRLRSLYNALEQSEFFSTHEFIGSSLLFVHDKMGASVWLIDFAKTVATPPGVSITHRQPWEVGNHEDGYLIGLSNLIGIFEELLDNRCGGYSKSLPPEIPA